MTTISNSYRGITITYMSIIWRLIGAVNIILGIKGKKKKHEKASLQSIQPLQKITRDFKSANRIALLRMLHILARKYVLVASYSTIMPAPTFVGG